MLRTTIMLPEDLKKRVETRAHQMNLSLGQLLRGALEEFLQRDERSRIDDPLASGEYVITAPAPLHVSENVDKYIYGKKK